ncbi:hypothetical protein [Streptomyces fradiae]|uniref:hypothetical protein n=1 Tax=Streptomyces fradiae TaxID=1906 RepID=UPI0039888988
MDVLWLDEWRDPKEQQVEVTSTAFEAPAKLTFTGRQYAGQARLRKDASPGQASARVTSHHGQSVRTHNFWIDEPSIADDITTWSTAKILLAMTAVVIALGGGWYLYRARRLPRK